MKNSLIHKGLFLGVFLLLAISCFSAYADVRIMSYNIKNFWLRFDGEPGSITSEGANFGQADLKKLGIVAGVISKVKPDVIGILECASLAELLCFNERFLERDYNCWSFRAYDSRTTGIPLGLMVRKGVQVDSVDLVGPGLFSYRGIIIADISKEAYEFTLILVHLKSKMEKKLGESALKRDEQGDRLREIIKEKLEKDPSANIIICGDFNDAPGRDDQEEAGGVEDLIDKMVKPVILEDGTEVRIHNPTLERRDVDINGGLWTEKSKGHTPILFDYFFLAEGANNEFLRIDHIYPEEFRNILEASDHIPIVLDLADE